MAKVKKKKVQVPSSVLKLRWSPIKFAKKEGIRLKGKKMGKKDKRKAEKTLWKKYSEFAAVGLNKAVKILTTNYDSDSRKIEKLTDAVDNVITNNKVMRNVARLYNKDRSRFPNMKMLPHMLMNTVRKYSAEGISEEDKAVAETIDNDFLIGFCEKILKKEIKKYRRKGLSKRSAFSLANVIPTAARLKSSAHWYRVLIKTLYEIAEHEDVDLSQISSAILKLDKKKELKRRDFYEGFYLQFILTRVNNRIQSYNSSQKELHETLMDNSLAYLDDLKKRDCKEVLKAYIRARKRADKGQNDSKRVIKFVDQAHSNSPYTSLKSVVLELISDNSNNEFYLS